jgi:hypothetical protein
MIVAFLMLYGNGWTQRWRIASDVEADVRSQISKVGTDNTGQLTVIDPGTESEATLVVAWALVAAAVVLDSAAEVAGDSAGQYA